MAIAIKMPKLSPTMETGVLSSWLVKEGDTIKVGDVIGEIETDKAIMEIEALDAGTIAFLGDVAQKEVPINSVIGYILKDGEKAADSWEAQMESDNAVFNKNKPIATVKIEEPKIESKISISSITDHGRLKASPLAKKIASQNNIDLNLIKGSGPDGRIVKADLENVETKMNIASNNGKSDLASHEVAMTGMRKIIAQRLTAAKQEIPHIYLQKKICMDNMEKAKNNLLEKFDFKVSMTPFFIKATALALKDNPILNRSFENGKIIQHNNYNINIAIAVENGLVVPVIKHADSKNMKEIANELKNLSNTAKEGRLTPEQSAGGTFSISNLGMFGTDSFQAILNPPQVGILAVAATGIEAVFENGNFVPKRIMKCTLSADHRVVDGADAAKFLNSLASYIENPEGMLL